jgi:hypothetical protein
MAGKQTLEVIEVAWSGPFSSAQVRAMGTATDRGLLAIYGSHPVFGADALLYIDEARDAPFAHRLARVEPWLKHLPSEPTIYVGRLGGTDAASWDGWLEDILRAYRLAVFFHSPPWNTVGVNHHGLTSATVLLNVGRRHRLALEVSTLWDLSAFDPTGGPWHPFAPEPPEAEVSAALPEAVTPPEPST